MSDITEKELKREIEKILKDVDLTETTQKAVRLKLEKVFGVELIDKRDIIKKLVVEYAEAANEDDSAEEDGSASGSEEEEEEKKPTKRAAPASKASAKKKKKASSEEEEDDSSESDSESDNKKRTRKKKDDGKKGKKAPAKKRGGKGGGYTRTYRLSPQLAELMGQQEMPRHEVVKRMWGIIKEKKLYDPNNKQYAICDDALYKVFGIKRFRTFGMMKILKNHFLPD